MDQNKKQLDAFEKIDEAVENFVVAKK